MTDFPLDRNCFVTSITLVALRRFGFDIMDWDPLVARDHFEAVFNLPKMPQKMFDKLNCGLMLVGTSLFTDSIEGFLTGTACMNNLSLSSSEISYCTFKQCAWGVWEYININGDMDSNTHPIETFCPDVIYYIQQVAHQNGISKMPEWLNFAKIPDNALPDMTGDVNLFEQYMRRQNENTEELNIYVTQRQKVLGDELKMLASQGFIG